MRLIHGCMNILPQQLAIAQLVTAYTLQKMFTSVTMTATDVQSTGYMRHSYIPIQIRLYSTCKMARLAIMSIYSRQLYLQVISSVSMTATEVWSTASSIMVATIPICFQPHDWIGVSSRSAGWAALIHTKSSNSDPSSMHCLAFLYMEVAAGTDPCA